MTVEWIPVSQRVPRTVLENGEELYFPKMQVTYNDGSIGTAVFHTETKVWGHLENTYGAIWENGRTDGLKVIAWAELLDPYEPDRTEI